MENVPDVKFTPGYMTFMERLAAAADRMPRASKLLKLAEILNCSVSDLFTAERAG